MNFDEQIALELGVECAILLSNIQFWVKKNRANGEEKHFHDGRWWTYNSAGSFAKLFPYWKERTVYNYLDKLEKAGYVMSGNYNKFKYDRTKWYTSETEKSLIIPIRKKMQMDLPKSANAIAESADASTENCGPIPYINTDKKQTDINSDSNDWQAIVLYFYSKISPETKPSQRFYKGTKEAAIHLLSLHSVKDIKERIDALAVSSEKKFMMRFELFCPKYSTIKLPVVRAARPEPVVKVDQYGF